MSYSTRPRISSRMGRTASRSSPSGSSRTQSSYRLPGYTGHASPQPMVTTTSGARTISSVHGLGNSVRMSMPTSAIASTAAGLTVSAGSDPPENTSTRFAARCSSHAAAICDRPALCTHRKTTLGLSLTTLPSTIGHMRRRITVVAARELSCPRREAVAAIWNIKNIERTEVKADAVAVSPETPERGTYRVRGHFAYVLHEGGFHSRNVGVPPEEATIEGGFIVTPLAGGCTVIHYEQYVLARWLVPLRSAIRAYLRWSMSRELRDLERLIA